MEFYRYLLVIWSVMTTKMVINASENIALMKPTSQSSTLAGGISNRVVDGCTATNMLSNCCSRTEFNMAEVWWRVDLQTPSVVDNVTIIYRDEGTLDRFAGYEIYLSNTSDWSSGNRCHKDTTPDLASMSHTHNVTCPGVARYLTIYNDRRVKAYPWYSDTAWLELCEVQVYGCPVGKYGNGNCNNDCINCQDDMCDTTSGICGFVDHPFTVTITPGLEERVGPILTLLDVTAVNAEIKFEHSITFNDDNATAEDYLYDVNWYINDNPLTSCSHAMVAYTNLSATRLKEECWRDTYKLNFLVRCEVRLRGVNFMGPFRSSESFKAGFTTDQNEYIVAEGSSIDVLVTLTVPLGCVYLPGMTDDEQYAHAETNCRTEIRIRTQDQTSTVQCSAGEVSNEPVSFAANNCGLRLSPNDWATTKSLKVYGASDNMVNVGSRSSYIRLEVFDNILYHPAWNGAVIPDILVVVEDEDSIILSNECRSYNDPHMETFDGRLWENQRLGEFVLYHNTEKLYWVHAMYQSCKQGLPGPTCNCGVAVRNNEDVFVANFCDAEIGWYTSGTPSNQYIQHTFCDDTVMLVKKDGNSYTITLPTGTQISFAHHFSTWYNRALINVIYVKPSLADWKTSSGLCGYLDGKQSNDFRTKDGGAAASWEEFALDWKITQDSESLFGEISLPSPSLELPQYCKCRSNSTAYPDFNNEVACSLKAETVLCSYTHTDSFFKTCDKPSVRNRRTASHPRYRRSTSVEDVPPKFKIEFAPDANDVPEPPTWRNGWNETLADDACRTFIRNQNFLKKCEEVLEGTANNNEEGIQSCVSDIKLMGNTEFMQSTADFLAMSCRMIALKLENLTQTTAADGTAGQTVLDSMLDLDCRNNCSGNGVCLKGKCQCVDDFEGDECSTKPSLPPVISPRTNPGLCKRDVYPCNTFYISGSNIAQENVTCRAAHFTITDGVYSLTSNNDTFPAQSTGGGFGCSCTLSDALRRSKRSSDQDNYQDRAKRSTDQNPVEAEGYFLGVSNDGDTYSDDIVVIIYDSSCQECNTTTVSCVEFTSCITTTALPTSYTTNLTDSTTGSANTTTSTTATTTTTTEPITKATTTAPTTTTTAATTIATTTAPTATATTTAPTTTTTAPTTTTTAPTTTTTAPTTTTTTTAPTTTTTTAPTTTTTAPTTTTTAPTTIATTTAPTTTTTATTTTTTTPTTTTTTTPTTINTTRHPIITFDNIGNRNAGASFTITVICSAILMMYSLLNR